MAAPSLERENQDMFHHTMVGASDYSKKADIIDELMIGIEDRKAVFITYQSLRSTEPVPQKDGSLVAEFDLDHTEEIKRWILSFGQHATVLEPSQLRNDIAAELKAILDKYERSKTSLAEGDEP